MSHSVTDRLKRLDFFEVMLFAWITSRSLLPDPPTQRESIRDFLKYFNYEVDDSSIRTMEAVFLRKRSQVMELMRSEDSGIKIGFYCSDPNVVKNYIDNGFLYNSQNQFEIKRYVQETIKKTLEKDE